VFCRRRQMEAAGHGGDELGIRGYVERSAGARQVAFIQGLALELGQCSSGAVSQPVGGFAFGSGPQVKQRAFHGGETLAKLLILNGLLKLAKTAISVSDRVALGGKYCSRNLFGPPCWPETSETETVPRFQIGAVYPVVIRAWRTARPLVNERRCGQNPQRPI
jgi:hypothetical protein